MNYWAILVCAIVAMVIGSIWYGPLFGKQQMEFMGANTMSQERKDMMKKAMGKMFFLQFIMSFITAWVLDAAILNWAVAPSGVGIAILLWFGFILTTEGGAALWSGKSTKMAWKMFFISAGSSLITFIAYGLILSSWR